MRMNRLIGISLFSVLFLSACASTTSIQPTATPIPIASPRPALGSQPPAITTSYAGQEQRGKLGSYCWNGCADTYILIPTQPITVPSAAKIQFTMTEPIAPHQLLATIFPVDSTAQSPWSDPNFLALHEIVPFIQIFPSPAPQFEIQMPDRAGDYVLSLFAEWQTAPSSGPDAFYGFHIVVGDSSRDSTPVVAALTPEATAINPYGSLSRIASPDGKWTAVLDTRVGSLDLQRADGKMFTMFAPGSTANTVSWSPNSRRALVVRTNYILPQPNSNTGVIPGGPVQVWKVGIGTEQPDAPSLLYETPGSCANCPAPLEIDLGHWSPNSGYILFWLGMLSGSIQADGVTLFSLDLETGKATKLADSALLNPRYQSWAPDSSAVAFTAGGYRSAQVSKWLDLFDVATGQVTTVVSQTEAIPGIVAWSPRGDWIAYAAVSASDTNNTLADWMSFDNTTIQKRRVFMLNPKTREHHRLNQVDAFQDAPVWSDDGATLYYVQLDGKDMVLMAANPSTGQAQIIDGSRRPAPVGVGYYGQSNWDDLLSYRRAASSAPIPPLTQTYTDAASGFTLRYPSGWSIGKGWETLLYRCDECVTISSDASVANSSDLTSFSGRAFISIELVTNPEPNLDALLARALLNPGPGQYVGFSAPLSTFDKRTMTINGQSAMRVATMDESGTTNHVLIVTAGKRAVILRGRGDGRVYDAIAATLKFQ